MKWIEGSRITFLFLLAICMFATSACSSEAGEPSDLPDASGPTEATEEEGGLTLEEISAWGMAVGDKQELLSTGFPFQAPVLDGRVEDVDVDATGMHFYRLSSDKAPEDVVEWYRRTYLIADWELQEDSMVQGDLGVVTMLVLVKGSGAWSRILIEPLEEGSTIEANVGVGSLPE